MKDLEYWRGVDNGFPERNDILCDAYSYDKRNQCIWDSNWKESDDFFYDNPEIVL